MGSVIQFVNDSGVVGWVCIALGFGVIALVIERAKVLYFDYAMNTDEFMSKIQSLVLAKKQEEAILVCNQLESKPIASAFRTILEKSDRDDDTI